MKTGDFYAPAVSITNQNSGITISEVRHGWVVEMNERIAKTILGTLTNVKLSALDLPIVVGAWTLLQALMMSLRFSLKFVEIRPAEASEACMGQKIPGGVGWYYAQWYKDFRQIRSSERRAGRPAPPQFRGFLQ
jgi:hypothetical protein